MKITKLLNKEYKITLKHIITNTFQYLLIIYLLFLLIDQYKPIKFINLNYFLILVIILGVLTVLVYKPEKIKKQKPTKKDYYFIFILGIIGTILIYLKIKELGWLAYLISIMGGILIIVLSHLFLKEKNEE